MATKTTAVLTIEQASEIGERLAREWHEAERSGFSKRYPAAYAAGLYDGDGERKNVVVRRKYVLLDQGVGSGRFLIDPTDGVVYGIKGYGVPNRLHRYGKAAEIDGAALARY